MKKLEGRHCYKGGPLCALLTAAGYDSEPGSNAAVAGVPEEIHHYLGTNHRDILRVGFATNQDLPLGPIDCP